MEIINFDDTKHRSGVLMVLKSVFNYKDARNNPEMLIDKKLAVNDDLFFVATENGEVIGTVMAGYDGHRGWIYSLAVVPEYRRRLVGTKLLEHAESKLSKLGCVKINLQILLSNENVKNFYLKNGFKVEERISMGKEISENIKK